MARIAAIASPSPSHTDAKDGDMAAGGAFAAGFWHAGHDDPPHRDCLALGHAAAAASRRAINITDGVGTIVEYQALAERCGWR